MFRRSLLEFLTLLTVYYTKFLLRFTRYIIQHRNTPTAVASWRNMTRDDDIQYKTIS